MDNFIVSARKYRPQNFDSVIGQQSISNTLKRAIVSNKLAGAYLFCGPRGVGKTTCARIFAKTINCLNLRPDGEACDECDSCKSFNEGRSVNVQELNAAANNSVDDIRNIIDQVRIPPQLGKYKVVILDEVHMLTTAAANALLKTLEEPPSYVVFILATTEKHKIMPTILSRCQIFDFNRMGVNDIISQLKIVADKEGIACEDAALNIIARKADGGMRDALSIFDQVASFSGGNITFDSVLLSLNVLDYDYYFKMTDSLLEHKVTQAMLLFNDILAKGFNGGVFISGLASHLRDLLVSRTPETTVLLDVADDMKERYTEQAHKCTPHFLYKAISLCDRCGNAFRDSYNKRLTVEIALIEVSQIGTAADDDDSAGLGPDKTLKPLFKETNKSQSRPAAKQQVSPSITKTPITPSAPNTQNNSIEPSHSSPASSSKGSPSPAEILLKQFNSVSIKSHAKVSQAAPVQDEATDTVQPVLGETPFDQTALSYYWNQYADLLPKTEQALQGRMKSINPQLKTDSHVNVIVNNNEVINFIRPSVPKIENYLRQKLNNRNIVLDISVIADAEEEIIYNPKELLKKMMTENSNLADLVKGLNLKID